MSEAVFWRLNESKKYILYRVTGGMFQAVFWRLNESKEYMQYFFYSGLRRTYPNDSMSQTDTFSTVSLEVFKLYFRDSMSQNDTFLILLTH